MKLIIYYQKHLFYSEHLKEPELLFVTSLQLAYLFT